MSNNVERTTTGRDVGGGFGRQTTSRGRPTMIQPIERLTVRMDEFIGQGGVPVNGTTVDVTEPTGD